VILQAFAGDDVCFADRWAQEERRWPGSPTPLQSDSLEVIIIRCVSKCKEVNFERSQAPEYSRTKPHFYGLLNRPVSTGHRAVGRYRLVWNDVRTASHITAGRIPRRSMLRCCLSQTDGARSCQLRASAPLHSSHAGNSRGSSSCKTIKRGLRYPTVEKGAARLFSEAGAMTLGRRSVSGGEGKINHLLALPDGERAAVAENAFE
jgi:hypothetical protein